eukprot:CAMPEP_0179239094 /NCGR_PEP_ID=MMETSP0797-20121207/15285_1 /TAXON_ID=47934 /ORGANISM="Dinophysis acuminata, Strain DAEP01" /LENGTH=194 /DNA_ID=CAMNT_0020946409 /DNA_START=60 /DNA_END=641 /DNA_ORIENTATION=-
MPASGPAVHAAAAALVVAALARGAALAGGGTGRARGLVLLVLLVHDVEHHGDDHHPDDVLLPRHPQERQRAGDQQVDEGHVSAADLQGLPVDADQAREVALQDVLLASPGRCAGPRRGLRAKALRLSLLLLRRVPLRRGGGLLLGARVVVRHDFPVREYLHHPGPGLQPSADAPIPCCPTATSDAQGFELQDSR